MAVEVLQLAETGYEGYKIATADAYRGCAVYTSGYSTTGDWMYCNIPLSSANAKLCDGIVTYHPLVETGSDTADSIDLIGLNSWVVVMKGSGKFKISGGALDTSWLAAAGNYWATGLPDGSTPRYEATAPGNYAWISAISGAGGQWSASSINTSILAGNQATANSYWGPRFKIMQLVGDTTLGVEVTLDVDWNRIGLEVAF